MVIKFDGRLVPAMDRIPSKIDKDKISSWEVLVTQVKELNFCEGYKFKDGDEYWENSAGGEVTGSYRTRSRNCYVACYPKNVCQKVIKK